MQPTGYTPWCSMSCPWCLVHRVRGSPWSAANRLHSMVSCPSCLWSTMECSQPAAWTTNRSLLLVASRAKAFPMFPVLRPSGVIGCHQCITSHSGNAPASPDIQPTPLLCPVCISSTTSIPAPTKPIIAIINRTHAPTVITTSA